MKLRFDSQDKKLILNQKESFRTDSGWDESIQSYEDELLRSIINPIENYETNRYIHKPYTSSAASTPSESAAEEEGTVTTNTQINTIEQTDIWFYFYFVKNGSYANGLDYKSVGISQTDKLLSDLRNSFFRLEFYKTPDGEQPNRTNRRLVFAKNLSPAVGERVSVTGKTEKFYVPVFMGSSMRNKENMYLFWFHDDTVLEETTLTGGTFFMSAKFYNAVDGSKILFGNKPIADSSTVTQEDDLYYRVEMSRNDAGEPTYHYVVTEENGTYPYLGTRKGTADNPILFYQMEGTTAAPTPTATPISSATPTPSATSNTPTPTPSSTSSSPTITWSAGTNVYASTSAPQTTDYNDISGTVTVTNGSVNVYIRTSKQGFNLDNSSNGSLTVTSIGSLSVTASAGVNEQYSLPSVLTIPPGTYNYTLDAEIVLGGGHTGGTGHTDIYTQ